MSVFSQQIKEYSQYRTVSLGPRVGAEGQRLGDGVVTNRADQSFKD